MLADLVKVDASFSSISERADESRKARNSRSHYSSTEPR